jgi:hypothetical protein
MRALLITGMLFLLYTDVYSQEITPDNTVNVPANGAFGGQNASVWPRG